MSAETLQEYHGLDSPPGGNIANRFACDMVDVIDAFEARASRLGIVGGLDTGFSRLTDRLEGLQPGLYMVSAAPNVGKTALCTQLAWQIADCNPTAFCMYATLDDNPDIVVQRLAAHLTGLPIRIVRNPRAYAHDGQLLQTRHIGIRVLREAADRFIVPSAVQSTDVDKMLEYATSYLVWADATDAERKDLVLFVDNFYDLTCEIGGDNSNVQAEYIADRLKQFAMRQSVPVVCTGELRKLNGPKRPTLDDAKGAGGIGYAAQVVLGVYNEVGQRNEAAKVYWNAADGNKMPILEVQFLKNKLSSFKGRLLYQFVPACSTLVEISEQEERRLNKLIAG